MFLVMSRFASNARGDFHVNFKTESQGVATSYMQEASRLQSEREWVVVKIIAHKDGAK